MPQVTVGGETLHYVRKGEGEPLLLVHSLGTASWLWEEQIARWSQRFDVIAFDVRGHGASTHNGTVTTRAIARDIHLAMEALGVARAHAVGISMGRPILSRLYAIDPAAIRSLVIADSFATQGAAGHERARVLESRITSIGIEAFAQVYADETILPSTLLRYHRALRGSIAACDQDAYIEALRSVFTEDVRDILAGMSIPVLVVVGDKDNRTPPALSEAIVALVPKAAYRRHSRRRASCQSRQPGRFSCGGRSVPPLGRCRGETTTRDGRVRFFSFSGRRCSRTQGGQTKGSRS